MKICIPEVTENKFDQIRPGGGLLFISIKIKPMIETLSNTFSICKKTAAVNCLEHLPVVICSTSLYTWFGADRLSLNPNCTGEMILFFWLWTFNFSAIKSLISLLNEFRRKLGR